MSEILQICWYDVKQFAGMSELRFFDSEFTIAEYQLDSDGAARWYFHKSTPEDKKIIVKYVKLEATEPKILRGSYCEIRYKKEQALYVASDIMLNVGYAFPFPLVISNISEVSIRTIGASTSLPEKGANQLKFKLYSKE